jgi:hypothetical protein
VQARRAAEARTAELVIELGELRSKVDDEYTRRMAAEVALATVEQSAREACSLLPWLLHCHRVCLAARS